MFLRMILSALLAMSLYVGWRAGAVRWVRRCLPWYARAFLLASLGGSYLLAREAEAAEWPVAARVLELVGAHWVGVLLLLTVALLAGDVVTGFGLFFRRRLPSIRGWSLAAGFALAAVALVQGNRPPVVREHEVRLPGLRPEDDGLVLVFVSDTHLGSMIGERWLEARVAQITALHPDLIVLGGDILEGDSPSERRLLPTLARLAAPLGVWAVPGNHDRFGGGGMLEELERLGIRVLRNESKTIRPGLALAGIDGGRLRRPSVEGGPAGVGATVVDRLAQTLAGRPPGSATILVSHAPSRVEDAARAGVGLMLAGHTHDGQIWPFRYVVRTQFPYLAGRYDVGGMPLVVSRGAGTWGPRMRLWHPGDILRVTLRSPGRPQSPTTPVAQRPPAAVTLGSASGSRPGLAS